jgi:corrinoid protein of di/trimethylamine methyltransferase
LLYYLLLTFVNKRGGVERKGVKNMAEKSEYFPKIEECIKKFRNEEIKGVVEEALKEGINPLDILEKGMLKGLWSVVEDYNNEVIWLPEVMLSANAFFAGMEILEPHISSLGEGRERKGRIVIGTVEKDIHSLGKNIVKAGLIAAGFDVYDLGADVPAEEFVRKTKEVKADIVASSTLMLSTMEYMADIEEELKKAGIRERVKTMIGGGPVSEEFARRIGVDAYGRDIKDAVEIAEGFVKEF